MTRNNIGLQTSYEQLLTNESDVRIPETPLAPWFVKAKKQQILQDNETPQKKKQFLIKNAKHRRLLTEPVKLQEYAEQAPFHKQSIESIIKLHFSSQNFTQIKNNTTIKPFMSQTGHINIIKETFKNKGDQLSKPFSSSQIKRKFKFDPVQSQLIQLYSIYKIPLLKNCNQQICQNRYLNF